MIIKDTEAQSLTKILLWLFVAGLVGLMSYLVFITHPVKNFRMDTLILWLVLSVILIPLSFYFNVIFRQKFLNLRARRSASKAGQNIGNTDCSGCLGFDDGIFAFLLLIFAFIAALFAGMFFAVILVLIEILVNFLFDISPKLDSKVWLHKIIDGLIISYACYFLALSITVLFS